MAKREEQVADLIGHKLNEVMQREIEFPAGVLVTITHVRLSPKRRRAEIFISCDPEAETGTVFGLLRSKVKELQRLVGEGLDFQFVPILQFRVDKSRGTVEEVERLLAEIAKEKVKK